jgi:hypothetical protein
VVLVARDAPTIAGCVFYANLLAAFSPRIGWTALGKPTTTMRFISALPLLALFGLCLNVSAQPAEPGGSSLARPPQAPWFASADALLAHQFDASLNEAGGDFAVNRFAVRGGVGYEPEFTKAASLSVGYDRDDYDFQDLNGLTADSPWGSVNTLRLGLPVRWGFDDRWTLFAIPAVRWTAEEGGDWGQALTGGGFLGFSYRFNDKLTLGPGFGALTELEESPAFFPVLLIKWNITAPLVLETGKGLGASHGPGIVLTYAVSEHWKLALGGRYEKLRFRLDQDGSTPNGVGEERGAPVYLGATWEWRKNQSISLLGGVKFGGQLQLEDASGTEQGSSDYDPAPFLGLAVNLRF